MKNVRQTIKLMMAILSVMFMTAACGYSAKTYTFNVVTGDRIDIRMYTTGNYRLDTAGGGTRFSIMTPNGNELEGQFFRSEAWDMYNEYLREEVEGLMYLGNGKAGHNEYLLVNMYTSEIKSDAVIIKIDNSDTVVVIYYELPNDEIESIIGRLDIRVTGTEYSDDKELSKKKKNGDFSIEANNSMSGLFTKEKEEEQIESDRDEDVDDDSNVNNDTYSISENNITEDRVYGSWITDAGEIITIGTDGVCIFESETKDKYIKYDAGILCGRNAIDKFMSDSNYTGEQAYDLGMKLEVLGSDGIYYLVLNAIESHESDSITKMNGDELKLLALLSNDGYSVTLVNINGMTYSNAERTNIELEK